MHLPRRSAWNIVGLYAKNRKAAADCCGSLPGAYSIACSFELIHFSAQRQLCIRDCYPASGILRGFYEGLRPRGLRMGMIMVIGSCE